MNNCSQKNYVSLKAIKTSLETEFIVFCLQMQFFPNKFYFVSARVLE